MGTLDETLATIHCAPGLCGACREWILREAQRAVEAARADTWREAALVARQADWDSQYLAREFERRAGEKK